MCGDGPQDALTKAIIGTIGDIDSYQLPDAKGYTAFLRHLLKVRPHFIRPRPQTSRQPLCAAPTNSSS